MIELKSIRNYQSAFKLTRMVAILAIIAAFLYAGYAHKQSQKVMLQAMEKIRYIDREGNIYTSRPIEQEKARELQMKDHVKDYYTLCYQIDKNTFENNLEKAKMLAGRSHETEVEDLYERQEVYEKLHALNMSYFVEIDSVFIFQSEKPVKGLIFGKQTSRRFVKNGDKITSIETKRHLDVEFELFNISPTVDNVHGLLVENWRVFNWESIN